MIRAVHQRRNSSIHVQSIKQFSKVMGSRDIKKQKVTNFVQCMADNDSTYHLAGGFLLNPYSFLYAIQFVYMYGVISRVAKTFKIALQLFDSWCIRFHVDVYFSSCVQSYLCLFGIPGRPSQGAYAPEDFLYNGVNPIFPPEIGFEH